MKPLPFLTYIPSLGDTTNLMALNTKCRLTTPKFTITEQASLLQLQLPNCFLNGKLECPTLTPPPSFSKSSASEIREALFSQQKPWIIIHSLSPHNLYPNHNQILLALPSKSFINPFSPPLPLSPGASNHSLPSPNILITTSNKIKIINWIFKS